jgi:hypothetical protein
MSTLKVTTIQTSAGGAVTLTKQDAAKAWWSLDGTGTIAFRDSFNTSGSTDLGTGDYKVAFTNNMSSANYSALGSNGTTDSNWNAQFQSDIVMGGNIANSYTPFYDASGIGFSNYANNSPQDTEVFNGAVLGDLA